MATRTKTAPKPKTGTSPKPTPIAKTAPVPLSDADRQELAARLAKTEVFKAKLKATPTPADEAKEREQATKVRREYEELCYSMNMVPRAPGAGDSTSSKHQAVEVKNEQNVPVATIERTSKTTHLIFGHSHTKFFVWAGREQWTVAEVQTALKALNIPEVSVLSIRTFLYAGRAEARVPGSGKRGEVVSYAPDQIVALNKAAGRIAPEPAPAPTKKGRKGK